MAYFLATVHVQIYRHGNPTVNIPGEMRLVEANSAEEAEAKVRSLPEYKEDFLARPYRYSHSQVDVSVSETIR